MPASSICHLAARRRRRRSLAPKHKGAELAQKPAVVALGDSARPAAQIGLHRFLDELFDDTPAHIDVAAVFDELALEHAFELRVGERRREPLHPAELEDLGPQIERRNADRMLVGGEVTQRKDIIGQRGIEYETTVGMPERILLRRDAAFVEQRIEIEHLVRRLVDNLLREQVFYRGREVVDFETLTPTAIDVIKHPLQRPQTPDQAVCGIAVEAALPGRLGHLLDRSRAALASALVDQLPRQVFAWEAGHGLTARRRRSICWN